ncbi:hypothetical protein [Parasphingorhabdus sp.]|jgi:hypothetical protein|uniref:hypothetical protein n=1 Tax=Parasphingorhabdus sp. TaxID=2709688 RepID=UPI0030A30762|nr:hypothetical protein [Sphingomonadales bacterium]
MRILTPIMITALLAIGGCTATGTDIGGNSSVDTDYIIKTIGEQKSCIMRSNIRSTDVVDDQTIDFKMRNGDIFRNNLPRKCSGLRFEEAFSYKTSINQLCNVDIIHVLAHTGGQIDTRGACGLGKFQKIEEIRKNAKEE